MKYFFITLILFLAIILETTLIQLPFVLVSLLVLGVLYKDKWIFLAAFLAGLLLDIVAFRTVGVSSLFFVSVLGVVYLYERKFEIQSLQFVGVATAISCAFYFYFFGSSLAILQLIFSVGMSLLAFLLASLFTESHAELSLAK